MPISVNGQSITDQQIKDFYAQGGNDNQWLQQNGVTDLNQIHQLANQARDIAGKKYSSQDYFKQYQSASPNGAFANDYNGWMNNISPTQRAAIENGSYTGVANAGGKDYGFGGDLRPWKRKLWYARLWVWTRKKRHGRWMGRCCSIWRRAYWWRQPWLRQRQ